MLTKDFNPWKHFDNYNEQMFDDKSSDLPQWPIKLWQVPEVSPYFHHAHLLIAADCSAFACPTFHDKLSKGKVPLLCCPAADFDIATQLEKIFSHNEIASITVARNSPLSLAIAVVTFPEQPLVSLALVIGPLIELPVLSVISGILKRWNDN